MLRVQGSLSGKFGDLGRGQHIFLLNYQHIVFPLITLNVHLLIDLSIQPVILDENIFEKDALQLNISWKSVDLGGESMSISIR